MIVLAWTFYHNKTALPEKELFFPLKTPEINMQLRNEH